MKNLYLISSILGALIPCVFFSQFYQLNGVNLEKFITDLFVNGAAGGFSADLLITSFVFWIWMFKENKVKSKWFFIILNLGIGLSCALPAYLFVLEKQKKNY